MSSFTCTNVKPLLKTFWRRFWTFTYKNSNSVCFGGFPRQGGNAKMLPIVTFPFKCRLLQSCGFKDEIGYSFTSSTAGSVPFSVLASTAVCRHKSFLAILKKF